MIEESERALLGTDRLLGTVVDWKGKFGWIRPVNPIDHPNARKHGGKLYLAVADVEQELEGVGAAVSFLVYADRTGLGATSVRPATPEEAAEVPQAGAEADLYGPPANAKGGGGGASWGPAAGWKGGKAAAPNWFNNAGAGAGWGKGTGGWAFSDGWAQSGGNWRGKNKPVSADPEQVCTRVHKALNDGVWNAAKQLSEPDPEWNLNEMTKRIVKYFYKAGQSAELLSMPWPEATTQFIEHAMQGYSAACGDRPWFFELDLSAALCNAIWEIVRVSHCPPRANYPEMEQVATAKYEELMDGILTEKAMWDAAQEVFGQEEPVSNKVYKTLKVSHEAAYNEAVAAWRLSDHQRVEMFMGTWMENSMSRAWQAIENSEMLLNPDTIARLFSKLVAPFGDEHPFSCVPAALTQSMGRPPSGWPFIWQAAETIHSAWVNPTPTGPAAKRRKNANSGLNMNKWPQEVP